MENQNPLLNKVLPLFLSDESSDKKCKGGWRIRDTDSEGSSIEYPAFAEATAGKRAPSIEHRASSIEHPAYAQATADTRESFQKRFQLLHH
jgi:hypothetical protein